MNLPHQDTTTLDVTHAATFIVSVIAKKDVVIINRNKKFISESWSLHPKYDNNIFLNLKLTFRHISTSIDTNVINIVLKYVHDTNHTPYPPVPLREVTFMIGKNNKQNKSTTKYITNHFSRLLYLLNLCNNFISFFEVFELLAILYWWKSKYPFCQSNVWMTFVNKILLYYKL